MPQCEVRLRNTPDFYLAAICWSLRRKSTVAMKGERRRLHRRSMDDWTQTVVSFFVKIASAVVEIWASALAACWGGSILEADLQICYLRPKKSLSYNWTEP